MVGTHEKERKQRMEKQSMIINNILSNDNLNRAYKQVVKNKGELNLTWLKSRASQPF